MVPHTFVPQRWVSDDAKLDGLGTEDANPASTGQSALDKEQMSTTAQLPLATAAAAASLRHAKAVEMSSD